MTRPTRIPRHAGDRLFVVSGCSGSGKSTLIEALARTGELVVPEPGRRVVRQELKAGSDGVPWQNAQRFIDLCAEQATRDFDVHASLGRRVFLDRSLIDVASAVEQTGLHAPPSIRQEAGSRRYARLVFLSPPWKALFATDEERRHSFEDAVAEYERLVPAYGQRGYQIVYLPEASVEERVHFLRSTVRRFLDGAEA